MEENIKISKSDYKKALKVLKSKEYIDAILIITNYEKQFREIKEASKKYHTCEHNWEDDMNTPPWERESYCTKCGRRCDRDGYYGGN